MAVFSTLRLLIRPYEARDFHHVFRLQSDEEIMRYIRPATDDVAVIRERTDLWLKYAADNPGYGVFMMESLEDQEFVGYGVVRHVEFQPGREIEIGYTITKEKWGQGYATEATVRLIDYATMALRAKALVAYTDEANAGSNRVLVKCGFERVGPERVYGADCLRWEK